MIIKPTNSPTIPGVEFRTLEWMPGYAIGSDGSVWSSWRGNWKKRKTSTCYTYPTLGVKTLVGPSRKNLHRIICEAFHGPCPKGMECRHLDGIKANNAAENLCWGTCSQNQLDRRGHGTSNQGSRHGNSKLTEEQVLNIRASRRGGETSKSIANRFGILPRTVRKIYSRQQWKHI